MPVASRSRRSAPAGTPTARLEDMNGTTCRWTTTAGDVLEVGVAKQGAEDATALKNDLVERSQSVPTYGGEAYFKVVDSTKSVVAIWLTTS